MIIEENKNEEDKVEDLLEGDDIMAIAQKGIAIYSKMKKMEKDLSLIKNKLREYGKRLSGDSGEMIEIETPDGNIQISFQSDRVYVAASDMRKVESLLEEGFLTQESFQGIFREVPVYGLQDNHEEALNELYADQKGKVEELLSKTVFNPSVKFPNT